MALETNGRHGIARVAGVSGRLSTGPVTLTAIAETVGPGLKHPPGLALSTRATTTALALVSKLVNCAMADRDIGAVAANGEISTATDSITLPIR